MDTKTLGAKEPAGARSWSVSTYLLMFALTIVVPAVLATAGLLLVDSTDERRALQQRMSRVTLEVSRDVEREMSGLMTMLEVLALSPALESGNLEVFRPFAVEASRRYKVNIVLRKPNGEQIINTRLPPGTPVPVTGMSRSDLAGSSSGRPYVSDLFIGRVRQAPLFAISVPVRSGLYAGNILSASVEPATWVPILKATHVPSGGVLEVYDRARSLVLSSSGAIDAKFDPEKLGGLRESNGMVTVTSRSGDTLVVGYQRLQLTNWMVTLSAPADELAGNYARNAWFLAAFTTVLLATATSLAFWFARQIVVPVERLAERADVLDVDTTLAPQRLGVREIDNVMAKLADASRRLTASHEEVRRSEHSLEQINATLEQRVSDRTSELETSNIRLKAEIEQRESTLAQHTQAQKLEALGQLTSSVAHDFNNQLLAILGNLELLGKQVQEPRLVRQIQTARSAARRASQLTNQLLAFSRRNQLEPSEVNVADAFDELEEVLRHAVGTNVDREIEIADDALAAWTDPDQLHATLLNVAINARDAMGGSGRLTIRARKVLVGQAEFEAGPVPGEYVVISMTDTGTGMSDEVLKRATEPFFTTKPRGKGTGLGLAMARSFAENSRGSLKIASTPGQGTTVSIYLPAAPARARGRPGLVMQKLPPRIRQVLCVDDDRGAADVTSEFLRQLGVDVTTFTDPARALTAARSRPAFDLLVSDMDMPGLDGFALAEEMRRSFPGIEIVFVTGHQAHEEQWRDAHDRIPGAVLLRKPFTADDLARAILTMEPLAPTESAMPQQ